MPPALPAAVANTDERWFEYFRLYDRLTPVDEVNFWRPAAQSGFHAVGPGEPFFFRLKAPVNAIAGFGFFAIATRLSVEVAWEFFGDRNGAPNYTRFEERIREYRAGSSRSDRDPLTCLILRDAVFLPQSEWLPWGSDEQWQRNIVAYKVYDLASGPGVALAELLQRAHPLPVPDLQPAFLPLEGNERERREVMQATREGQGTFRLRLLRAYDGQCAVTGEHAVPVLEAAHIQPYLGPASNHPQNGLVLRSDLHRLYDGGYVTVTPGLRLDVSPRLREEFENGKLYYEMAGKQIHVPGDARFAPSAKALEWHAEHVFR